MSKIIILFTSSIDLVTSTPRPSASETLKNLFPAIPTESEAVVMNKDVTADPSYVPETMELIHTHAKSESKGKWAFVLYGLSLSEAKINSVHRTNGS